MQHYLEIQKLIDWLEGRGFKIQIEYFHDDDVYQYHFSNDKIIGAFSLYNSYKYFDGRLAADNKNSFNKWSQCPLVIKLPQNELDYEKLNDYFNFLATDEAAEWSSNFGYHTDPKLTREIDC